MAPIPLSPKPTVPRAAADPVQAQYAQAAQPPATQGGFSDRLPSIDNGKAVTIQPRPSEDGLQRAAEQAAAINQQACKMAQKGMLFAARNELIHALEMVAQSIDLQHGNNSHLAALSAGFAALDEAGDFAPQAFSDQAAIDVIQIARGHRTTLLHARANLPAAAAQQHYFELAQQQLALAAGGEPVASQTLFVLGRIQSVFPATANKTRPLGDSRAIVFFQAALVVDERNYQAANELGVLLARNSQLDGARRALLHSVSIQPQVETWNNLAVVHQRLGEHELASLAENERQLLAQRQARSSGASTDKIVTWVDAKTFAAAATHQRRGPQSAAARMPTSSERR